MLPNFSLGPSEESQDYAQFCDSEIHLEYTGEPGRLAQPRRHHCTKQQCRLSGSGVSQGQGLQEPGQEETLGEASGGRTG